MSESDEKESEDIAHKIARLDSRSEHPDFENVGYINWVHDKIEDENQITLEIIYPNSDMSFEEKIDWPEDLKVDSKLKKFIESPKLPFSKGNFNNTNLQDAAVPIDVEEEKIIIPEKELPLSNIWGIRWIAGNMREMGAFSFVMFYLLYSLTALTLILVCICIIWVIIG